MVVSKHIGRLGNNMFQIAAAIGYARKYGYEWAADYSSGHGEPYSAIHKVFPNLPKHELHGLRYHEHPRGICPTHNVLYDDCHFDYHEIPNLGPNLTLTGFYQSWKYFEHCKEEVKQVFALPHIEGYEDYVSIHVRRGDYVQHSGSFPPVTDEYLLHATDETDRIPFNLDQKSRKYLVFSDDIEWCKDYFKKYGNDVEFYEPGDEFKSLSAMASCSHHIIANSTFGYWGAYLGHNPDRIIVTPSHKRGSWFGMGAGIKKDCVDLIPDGWVEIERV